MAERGPPAPKPPTTHKPMKTEATEQARIIDPPQQNPPLEPEVVVVPQDQVPDSAPPNPQDPPAPALQCTYQTQYNHKTLQNTYLTQYYHQLFHFRYHN